MLLGKGGNRDMHNTDITVYRAIRDLNQNRLSAPALYNGGECLSYAELFELADKTADILTTAGLLKGDMIIAQIHGTFESVALLLAASKMGVSVMMLTENTSTRGTARYPFYLCHGKVFPDDCRLFFY